MNIKNRIICFSQDTKIIARSGGIPIDKIKSGDNIISYNYIKGITEEVIVGKTAYSLHTSIAKISFENNISINCTLDHPIWVLNKGWCSLDPQNTDANYNISVRNLNIYDRCMYFDNMISPLVINHIEILFGNFKMFIISAGDNHCFFANGILAHDENLCQLNIDKENYKYQYIKHHEQ